MRRDSDGIALAVGASFGLARSLTGEISAGIQHRTYVDPSLRDINAPLVNAALVWSMSPLTTVRLTAATGVTETTIPGSSGILTDVATREVQHHLQRNLSNVLRGARKEPDGRRRPHPPHPKPILFFLNHKSSTYLYTSFLFVIVFFVIL